MRHDWPMANVGAGQVRVRVAAAAVNNTDIWSREGAYGTAADPQAVVRWKGVPLAFPRIQGIDIAGEVVRVGDGDDDGWISRRVIVDPAFRYEGEYPADIVGSEVEGGFSQFHLCAERRLHDVGGSPLSAVSWRVFPPPTALRWA